MTGEDLILVTGATGNTGSAVLQQLETRGVGVRAMVRSSKDAARLPKTSATVVVGNLDDPRSLEAALTGVTRAYLVTPSSPGAEAQQVRFAELAAAAGVGRLVKLSQFAADESSPVRFLRYHAAVERRIRELGIGFTFLRPNLYFQGLLAFQSMIAAAGHFVLFAACLVGFLRTRPGARRWLEFAAGGIAAIAYFVAIIVTTGPQYIGLLKRVVGQ